MNPVEAARVTAALSHIGGLLDGLPLADYLEHLRAQRAALPYAWMEHSPQEQALRRRLQALIAAATKGLEIAEEVQTASAFWAQMRILAREHQAPHAGDDGPTVVDPAGNVLHPKFGRLAGTQSCDCAMGECEHPAGLDGPA